jgi:hypothetical protein
MQGNGSDNVKVFLEKPENQDIGLKIENEIKVKVGIVKNLAAQEKKTEKSSDSSDE